MNVLEISKDLEEGDKLQQYISDVIAYPEKYTEILRDFFGRCKKASPTPGHNLLSECSKKFNHLLVTENLDQLHQKSEWNQLFLRGATDTAITQRLRKSHKNLILS